MQHILNKDVTAIMGDEKRKLNKSRAGANKEYR